MLDLKFKWSQDKTTIILFIVSLVFFIIAACFAPPFFIFDEGTYALMIHEFSENPTNILPTVLNVYVEYKPPLFTWVYAPFYILLKQLPLNTEAAFRLPSALFSAASTVLVFLLGKKIYDRETGAIAAVLFMTSPLVIFMGSLAMMESFSIFLILSSIYFYTNDRIKLGALALFCLGLTKWLYAIVPIVFLVLYFLKSNKLKAVLGSFIAVPLSILSYLIVSYLFGNIDTTVYMLSFDVIRPTPATDSMALVIVNIYTYIGVTLFPYLLLFAYLAVRDRAQIKNELPVVAWVVVTLPIMLSKYSLFWYAILAVPALLFFIANRIAAARPPLTYILVSGLIVSNLILAAGFFSNPTHHQDVKEVAVFASGRNQTIFLESNSLYPLWEAINNLYLNTSNRHLLLEQSNPGFLFYRFKGGADTSNLLPVFVAHNQTFTCGDGEYLIVHKKRTTVQKQTEIPTCFAYEYSTTHGEYDFYRKIID